MYSSHKNRYNFFTVYTRAMDGGAPWVIITYVRGTPAAISIIDVGDITVMIYNPGITTAVSIYAYGLTQVYLGATAVAIIIYKGTYW